MNPSASLGPRYPLHAVASGFILYASCPLALDAEDDELVAGALVRLRLRAVLSAEPSAKSAVGIAQIGGEQARVGAALSGTDLDRYGFSLRHVFLHEFAFMHFVWHGEGGQVG